MRRPRAKLEGAYYHATSRCAFQTFAFSAEAKDVFVRIMRRAECFSGVKVANYCVMDNHFHILVKVPKRREVDDAELDRRIIVLYGEKKAQSIFQRWRELSEKADVATVKRERDAYRARMFDISQFMKTLKQRFSLWYSTHHDNFEGTIWQGRFHSTLVENSTRALSAVSAYIDLNPVRAGIADSARSYAWSGFGAACAGDEMAKSGILEIMAERLGEDADAKKRNWRAEAWRRYRQMVSMREGNAKNDDVTPQGQVAPNPPASPSAGIPCGDSAAQTKPDSGLKRLGIKERRLSRGLSFGSSQYVSKTIVKFRGPSTNRTHAVAWGRIDGKMLCCAGRAANGDNFVNEA